MSSVRRRTYWIGGWLMSGEVLFNGYISLSGSGQVTVAADKATFELSETDIIVFVDSASADIAGQQPYLMTHLTNGVDKSFIYTSYAKGTGLTFKNALSSGRNLMALAIAIPRTDV